MRTKFPQMLSSLQMIPRVHAHQHLVVVVTDQQALDACTQLHHICVLNTVGSELLPNLTDIEQNGYVGWINQSAVFKAIVWRKVELVREILEYNVTVIATDLDIAFFRDPTSTAVLPEGDSYDFVIQTEFPEAELQSHDNGEVYGVNTGFYMVRPTTAGKALMDAWLLHSSEGRNQPALNNILATAEVEYAQWRMLPVHVGISLCFYLDTFEVLSNINEWRKVISERLKPAVHTMAFFHSACCAPGWQHYPACKDAVLLTVQQVWLEQSSHSPNLER